MPKPKVVTQHRNFFGYPVTVAQIDVPHKTLRIEARALVTVEREVPQPGGAAWERVRTAAQDRHSLRPEAPAHFLFPSARIRFADSVTAYARASFAPESAGGRKRRRPDAPHPSRLPL